MKIKVKFLILLGKILKFFSKIINREGSNYIGNMLKNIDPNLLSKIKKPETIITITGTNGKTTTTNMIVDILNILNIKSSNNSEGANLSSGIISSLVDSSSIIKGNQPLFGVFEIDELWSKYIFNDFVPSTLTITNLFQDSFERNANVFYIKRKLEQSIPKQTKLILNASDSISSTIAQENERVYYDVQIQDFEIETLNSKIEDLKYCPNCDSLLEWDFKRYHHIGKYHCPNCDFKNPKAKYLVTKIDKINNRLFIRDIDTEVEVKLTAFNMENVFNQISAYATLRENGFSVEELVSAFEKVSLTTKRFNENKVGNKEIYKIVTKGYNSIAVTRAFDTIRKSNKNKTVIINIEDYWEEDIPIRTPGWIFSIDFKLLDEKVNKLIVMKSRNFYEIQLSAIMDNIPLEKIICLENIENIRNYINKDTEEEIYILHDFGEMDIKFANEIESEISKFILEA